MVSISNFFPKISISAMMEGAILGFQKSYLRDRSVYPWPQAVMRVGVVAAVIGVAIAIFAGSFFTVIGFALLGVISTVGFFLKPDFKDVNVAANVVEKTVQIQKVAVSTLTHAADAMKQAVDNANKENSDLAATIVNLRRIATEREASIQTLQHTIVEIRTTNTGLRGQIDQIGSILNSFTQSLTTFNQENLTLRASLGVLDSRYPVLVNGVQALGATVERFEDGMRRNLEELNRSIQTAKIETTTILDHYQQQANRLAAEKESLSQTLARLHNVNDDLTNTVQRLKEVEEERERYAAQLELLQRNYEILIASKDETIVLLAEERRKWETEMNPERAALSTATDTVARSIEDFDAVISKMAAITERVRSQNDLAPINRST